MRVGSIVRLINDNWSREDIDRIKLLNSIAPVRNKDYTIRDIVHGNKGIGVTLEEIKNPIISEQGEAMFNIDRFRELLPPMDIEELMEEILFEPA